MIFCNFFENWSKKQNQLECFFQKIYKTRKSMKKSSFNFWNFLTLKSFVNMCKESTFFKDFIKKFQSKFNLFLIKQAISKESIFFDKLCIRLNSQQRRAEYRLLVLVKFLHWDMRLINGANKLQRFFPGKPSNNSSYQPFHKKMKRCECGLRFQCIHL